MPGYVAAELRPHPTPMQRSMRRPRSPARRLVGALALVAMAVLPSACEPIAPQGSESDSGVTLLRARTLTDRLASLAPEELTDAQVIALGYQERVHGQVHFTGQHFFFFSCHEAELSFVGF